MTVKREVRVAKVEKKVNNKDVAKREVMEIIHTALEEAGLSFKNGLDFGMTNGTIVVEHQHCDVQIKPITPKAGITRYDLVEYK